MSAYACVCVWVCVCVCVWGGVCIVFIQANDGLIKPEHVAELYMQLANQHRSTWTFECDVRAYTDNAWWNHRPVRCNLRLFGVVLLGCTPLHVP